MRIVIVEDSIPLEQVRDVAQEYYTTMIKGVVDVERGVIALGGEWHMDANNRLIEHGSMQDHVWGFNYVLDGPKAGSIEYHSLINIRPAQGNHSMEVLDESLREQMSKIILKRIQ
ncbi:MAG: DUF5674 family protein [Candidatus Uhrbacteria bacterium]|nr:DUF5674 family protein [Candidatus Uhrbacteria bacterium]